MGELNRRQARQQQVPCVAQLQQRHVIRQELRSQRARAEGMRMRMKMRKRFSTHWPSQGLLSGDGEDRGLLHESCDCLGMGHQKKPLRCDSEIAQRSQHKYCKCMTSRPEPLRQRWV